MRASIGVIGYGRFGRLLVRYLAERADVYVFDPVASPSPRRGIKGATLKVVASQPVVVLAVPISSLRRVLREIRGHVRPGSLVMDVCSVKVLPLRWMRRMLPRSVSVIGTHPLFGPDSDTGSLAGQRIVLCPGRGSRRSVAVLRSLAQSEGVHVQLMTPARHDRLMAETLLLAHYVGRLVTVSRVPTHAWATASYAHLLALRHIAEHDTEQLFVDMWRYNPFGRRMAGALERAHRNLQRRIRQSVDS